MRIKAIIFRILTQLKRDKRTLALLFVAPLAVLTLMYFVFNNSETTLDLAVTYVPSDIVNELKNSDVNVVEIETPEQLNESIDGWLTPTNEQLTNYHLSLENSDPNVSKILTSQVKKAIATAQINEHKQNASTNTNKTDETSSNLDVEYIFGDEDTTFFDVINSVLIGFFVFFFVFLISGIGLLRERMTGTLDRMLSTPVTRSDIIIGYLLSYGVIAVIQTTLILLYSVTVLDVTVAGSIFSAIITCIIIAFTALSLGILLSTFATNEFQMIQFIPLIIVPQIFFTGLFPLDTMPRTLQALSRFMPLYYGSNALKGIMYEGRTLMDVSLNLVILLLFTLLFVVLNVSALKKYRSI